jgi:hypothetical protein
MPADLRDRDVGLVHEDDEVLREVVEQRVRRLAGRPAVEVARVVLDAVAEADLADHLEVVGGAHAQALGLQQLVSLLELGEALGQLGLDRVDRALQRLGRGHVVGGREDRGLGHGLADLAGERVDPHDAVHLVAEELDPQGPLVVGREHLEGVAAHPEGPAHQVEVVARVLQVDELADHRLLAELLALAEPHDVVGVLVRRAQAVDAGHRGDHHHVATRQQRHRGAVAQPVDLVVDRRVLLDVGVGRGDVGLGLVVVVVADEVLDRVVGQEVAELVGQLRGQRLVRCHHQAGPLDALQHLGGGEGLARAGGAQQRDRPLPRLEGLGDLIDGLRLVAGGLEVADHPERGWTSGCRGRGRCSWQRG